MTAGKPFSPVRGKRIRVTKLTSAYAPDTVGTAAMGISSGFVSVKLTPQWDEGQKVQVKTAAGDLCVNEPGQLVLMNFQADIAFCGVDPDIFSLITGQTEILDGTSAGVGIRLSGGIQTTNGFALEVWTGISNNSATVSGNTGSQWGYVLLPFCYGGKVNDFTVENNAANFSITTNTREGSGWGVGPYNAVDTSATGSPVVPGKLLNAIGARDHLHMQMTTVAPPAAISGLATVAA
jgi:hypothetical protein